MGVVRTMAYDSAVKDRLTPATTQMTLEDMVLGEGSQTQENEYCTTPLTQPL